MLFNNSFYGQDIVMAFRHLNIVGCLLKRRPTKGGSRAPQDLPLGTPLFYFQVGIYSAVLSHHFARTKYMYILRVVHKKQFPCKNLCVFYIFTYS